MKERVKNERPVSWQEYREQRNRNLGALHRVNWHLSWAAWALGNWPLLDVLEHLGTFSVLIAVIFYFGESGSRTKQRHYQAWQVINTAQGKGGNGGRIDALEELNHDGVSLVGVDASTAFLQGLQLQHAKLSRCDLHASDAREGQFEAAAMDYCDLQDANFRGGSFAGADLESASLKGSDLNGAALRNADLDNADLSEVDLRNADMRGAQWVKIADIHEANIHQVRNADAEFVAWALEHGAVDVDSDNWLPPRKEDAGGH